MPEDRFGMAPPAPEVVASAGEAASQVAGPAAGDGGSGAEGKGGGSGGPMEGILSLVQALNDSMTPGILQGSFQWTTDLVARLDRLLVEGDVAVDALVTALGRAQDEVLGLERAGLSPHVTVRGVLQELRHPDTQAGLRFLLLFLRHLGRELRRAAAP